MLDISLFRPEHGGDPQVVKSSQQRRFADESLVDQVVELDRQWREAQYQREQLNKQLNATSRQVAALRKARQDSSQLQDEARGIKAQIEQAAKAAEVLQQQRDARLLEIGNIVHDSVPVHQDEAHNEVVSEGGPPRRHSPEHEGTPLLGHAELVGRLCLADLESGAAVAGNRGYYLLGEGVMLNQALIAYALHFLRERGWQPVSTPYWLHGDVMARCAQLSQFDDELYRLSESDAKGSSTPGGSSRASSSNISDGAEAGSPTGLDKQQVTSSHDKAKYLIATSEQALCALHQGAWLEESDLPLQYAGLSTCFRREAGSHGKDTLGIFRVHQFDKVEQFAVTHPGQASWEMLNTMMGNAADFYTSLGIPHRVVRIVSGALNLAAAAKLDLEGWFPASGTYRELVSGSNCTDYPSRRLDVRMRVAGASSEGGGGADKAPKPPVGRYVHMLNCTLAATQRTLCCILENHQTKEGVKIPAVLQPFMHGQDFIPFRRQLGAQAARTLVSLMLRRPT